MRKFLLLSAALLIAVLFAFSSVGVAETSNLNEDYKVSKAYSITQEICEKFPNRRAGINAQTPPENSVQEYLKNQLTEYGIPTEYKRFQLGDNTYGFNIEGRLNKTGADKQIIIGAHYDSEGQGASDNAAGVAALLMIAEQLANSSSQLPCNVVFLLFDAEESGLIGSRNYAHEMLQEQRENTLVMFNIDSIANGDNLYLWCENKRTDLGNLIVEKSDGDICEKPYAKGTFNLTDSLGYGYYELVQNSDHSSFRLQGIPTAFIFSGTYDLDPWHYAENSDKNKQVMNSSEDTFENLEKNQGAKFVDKINATVAAVINTVTDYRFVDTAVNQRSQLVNLGLWYNAWWAKLIAAGILVILVVLALLYYRKLQKKAILGTAEVKTNKVFETPDAEDIFTFKR